MAEFPVGNTSDVAINFPFTAINLTDALDVIPNQWGLLAEMDMFDEIGVDTTIIEINYRDAFINLLASAERGSIPQAVGADDEAAVFIKAPHFPDLDLITPKDLENRWAFTPGMQSKRRRTLEDEVARRLMKIAFRHDLTLEYQRMGAIKGKIYDGKGKLLLDLFNTFGITQKSFTFAFSNTTTFFPQQMTFDVARYIELNLHGDVSEGIDVLCDPLFFNALTSHPKVQQFWINYRDAAIFRGDQRKQFDFGALRFIEYNAQVPTQPLAGILQQQFNEVALATNSTTAEGNNTLHFATGTIPTEVAAGWLISDYTNSAAVAAGATVVSKTATTVVMSANSPSGSGGVGSADQIIFQPPAMQRFIEPNTAYAFPRGTRDTFRTYFAPPYTINGIYREGMKRFVSPKILDHQRGIELFSESNPLAICRRPNVLVKLLVG